MRIVADAKLSTATGTVEKQTTMQRASCRTPLPHHQPTPPFPTSLGGRESEQRPPRMSPPRRESVCWRLRQLSTPTISRTFFPSTLQQRTPPDDINHLDFVLHYCKYCLHVTYIAPAGSGIRDFIARQMGQIVSTLGPGTRGPHHRNNHHQQTEQRTAGPPTSQETPMIMTEEVTPKELNQNNHTSPITLQGDVRRPDRRNCAPLDTDRVGCRWTQRTPHQGPHRPITTCWRLSAVLRPSVAFFDGTPDG